MERKLANDFIFKEKDKEKQMFLLLFKQIQISRLTEDCDNQRLARAVVIRNKKQNHSWVILVSAVLNMLNE